MHGAFGTPMPAWTLLFCGMARIAKELKETIERFWKYLVIVAAAVVILVVALVIYGLQSKLLRGWLSMHKKQQCEHPDLREFEANLVFSA
jgi:hypothetical protein